MENVLATVALIERDAHLRRDAAAWAHLHPSVEAPERLPVDLVQEPWWPRLVRRLAVRPTPRASRARRPAARSVVVTPTMTRG